MGISSTQVVIFSPYELHRAAWRALLTGQPGIDVVGSLAGLDEIASFQLDPGPCTCLVDLLTPQPEFVHKLHAVLPGCGLLFLVEDDPLEKIWALLKAGGTGIVSRNQAAADLSRAIIAAGRGELVLPAKIAIQSLLFLAGNDSAQNGPSEPLTSRENDVLTLLAQGQTNKDIAQALFLSVRTVEAHMRTIFGKIGVRSRTEAALWAVRQGFGRAS
jgi:NarL family two-component system response regulator LiaR